MANSNSRSVAIKVAHALAVLQRTERVSAPVRVAIEDLQAAYDEMLKFAVEFREGDDGAGGYSIDAGGAAHFYSRPATKYQRLVGPWEKIG